MRPLLLLFALIPTGCATDILPVGDRCEVAITAINPAEAEAGGAVSVTAGPLTAHYDTSLWVGGERALVTELVRTGCEACDTCRSAESCSACDDCDACDSVCTGTCVESVEAILPDLPAGPATAVLFNSYGASRPAALTITEPATDTGSTDTGTSGTDGTDTGTSDTGSTDTGTSGTDGTDGTGR